MAWLRATFEPVSALASRIEQQDLYKMYLTACSKIGRTGVVSQYHFPRCVRSVFGGTVGPNQIKIKQNAMEISSYFYEGIRIRAQPLAVVHKGTILVIEFNRIKMCKMSLRLFFFLVGFIGKTASSSDNNNHKTREQWKKRTISPKYQSIGNFSLSFMSIH